MRINSTAFARIGGNTEHSTAKDLIPARNAREVRMRKFDGER